MRDRARTATSAGWQRPLTPSRSVPAVRDVLEGHRLHARPGPPEAGVMETDWAENRAKLPQDFIRAPSASCSIRCTRPASSTSSAPASSAPRPAAEIFITHRGMDEVYIGQRQKDQHRLAAASGRPAAGSRIPAPPDGQARRARQEQARDPVAAARTRRARRRVPDREGQPTPTLQSTTASTAPGAGSAWRSTAAASRWKTATAARACTSCATSTRHSPAARSPASSPSVQPARRRARGTGQVPRQGQQRRDEDEVAVLDSQGKAETRRSRHADRRPAPRRPALVIAGPRPRRPLDAGRRRS